MGYTEKGITPGYKSRGLLYYSWSPTKPTAKISPVNITDQAGLEKLRSWVNELKLLSAILYRDNDTWYSPRVFSIEKP